MSEKRITVKDDIMEIKTNKRMLKKLEKIIELRVLDLKGKLIMTFWKGDIHE